GDTLRRPLTRVLRPPSHPMQNPRRDAGFTLIELLVVIMIIGLLAVALAPEVFSARNTAAQAADQANLRRHYQNLTAYQTRYKALPSQPGAKFVLAPWVRGIVQRTPEEFQYYWLPETPDPHKDELAKLDPKTIWRDFDEITSLDTHYAGPGEDLVRRRLYGNGELPLMADDNEFGPSWEDHTIHVLLGNGQIRVLLLDPDLLAYNFDADQPGAVFPVGPESPHELLQQLMH